MVLLRGQGKVRTRRRRAPWPDTPVLWQMTQRTATHPGCSQNFQKDGTDKCVASGAWPIAGGGGMHSIT